jgi:autotransporter passenger strand-loop-strand repeat protein
VSSAGQQYVYGGGVAISTVVGSGAAEYVSAGGTASDTTVNSRGADDVYSGGTVSLTTVSSGGTEVVSNSGTAIGTTVDGGGSQTVLSHGSATSTTVDSAGTEYLSSGNVVSDTVVNVGGTIDVAYLTYVSGGSANVSPAGLLTVSVGSLTYHQQLAGNYADEHFTLESDGHSGTFITAEAVAPCYRNGTRILADRGEVAVEALRVGDLVRTVLGKAWASIVWVGHREVDCRHHPQPRNVWPVRVAAGAFGPGRPHSDLFLSPDHAIYVNEVLIPAKCLINGSTIMQVPVDRVKYHHVELAEHDVLLAEGLPAESFLDMRDGSNYANRPGPIRLYPDYAPKIWEAFGCARLVVTGPELLAARVLVARFATGRAAA